MQIIVNNIFRKVGNSNLLNQVKQIGPIARGNSFQNAFESNYRALNYFTTTFNNLQQKTLSFQYFTIDNQYSHSSKPKVPV
jgi:hypothetical protein